MPFQVSPKKSCYICVSSQHLRGLVFELSELQVPLGPFILSHLRQESLHLSPSHVENGLRHFPNAFVPTTLTGKLSSRHPTRRRAMRHKRASAGGTPSFPSTLLSGTSDRHLCPCKAPMLDFSAHPDDTAPADTMWPLQDELSHWLLTHSVPGGLALCGPEHWALQLGFEPVPLASPRILEGA